MIKLALEMTLEHNLKTIWLDDHRTLTTRPCHSGASTIAKVVLWFPNIWYGLPLLQKWPDRMPFLQPVRREPSVLEYYSWFQSKPSILLLEPVEKLYITADDSHRFSIAWSQFVSSMEQGNAAITHGSSVTLCSYGALQGQLDRAISIIHWSLLIRLQGQSMSPMTNGA